MCEPVESINDIKSKLELIISRCNPLPVIALDLDYTVSHYSVLATFVVLYKWEKYAELFATLLSCLQLSTHP